MNNITVAMTNVADTLAEDADTLADALDADTPAEDALADADALDADTPADADADAPVTEVVKMKRGRKSKGVVVVVVENENKVHKKRGRKPKGGKIIKNNIINEPIIVKEHNIIMHLKCGEADLIQNSYLESGIPNTETIEPFQFEQVKDIGYQILNNNTLNNNTLNNNTLNNNTLNNNTLNNNTLNNNTLNNNTLNNNTLNNNTLNNNTLNNSTLNNSTLNNSTLNNNALNENSDTDEEIKNVWKKIKTLTFNLHNNNINDKKSDCFWCTCGFDNIPIYIPKYELNGTYYCYGCFCSPECATAFLFKETIDSSARFERYHLLNHLYCKIYNYKKNVKPAPDPFYTLNKYYGNLTIQEYRMLLKNERLLLVVDKPLSRTLPELHEDNDDFVFNGKSITSSSTKYNLKKKTKQTKTDILSETFNLNN